MHPHTLTIAPSHTDNHIILFTITSLHNNTFTHWQSHFHTLIITSSHTDNHIFTLTITSPHNNTLINWQSHLHTLPVTSLHTANNIFTHWQSYLHQTLTIIHYEIEKKNKIMIKIYSISNDEIWYILLDQWNCMR